MINVKELAGVVLLSVILFLFVFFYPSAEKVYRLATPGDLSLYDPSEYIIPEEVFSKYTGWNGFREECKECSARVEEGVLYIGEKEVIRGVERFRIEGNTIFAVSGNELIVIEGERVVRKETYEGEIVYAGRQGVITRSSSPCCDLLLPSFPTPITHFLNVYTEAGSVSIGTNWGLLEADENGFTVGLLEIEDAYTLLLREVNEEVARRVESAPVSRYAKYVELERVLGKGEKRYIVRAWKVRFSWDLEEVGRELLYELEGGG